MFPNDEAVLADVVLDHSVIPQSRQLLQAAMRLVDELQLDRGAHLPAAVTAVATVYRTFMER